MYYLVHFCGICREQEIHGPCGYFLGNDAEITICNVCLNCHLRRTASGTATAGGASTCNNAAVSSGTAVSTGTLSTTDAPVKANSLKCSLRQCKNTNV